MPADGSLSLHGAAVGVVTQQLELTPAKRAASFMRSRDAEGTEAPELQTGAEARMGASMTAYP